MAILLPGEACAGARKAAMTLSCLSLRVRPAQVSQLGFAYRLAFSTADDDSVNDELYRSGGTDEVGSFAILDYPGSEALGAIIGDLQLKTPMAGDLDVDGVTDFLQVNLAVPGLSTTGTIEVDDGMDVSRGTVTATWNRAAGSASGTVQLRVSLPDFSIQNLTFNHPFEIYQYSGTLTYDVAGTHITASIDLPRAGVASGESFKGPMPMERLDVATLARLPTSWMGPGSLDYEPLDTFGLEGIETTVNYLAKGLYAGLVVLSDGDPATPFMDEYDFFDLVIRDPNDANGNGIPDLSDVPAAGPSRPGISLALVNGRLRATLAGPPGARCLVERSASLAPMSWTTAADVTLGVVGNGEADLGPAMGDLALIRARIIP